ncbi:MAG: phosphate acyltransferase PlsX [Clostridia bacterium]
MKIAVDAFGGDNAPLEIIKGCIDARNEYNIDIILTGDEEKIKSCAKENSLDISKIEILHAPDVITMEDEATDIVKAKSQSSMAIGLKAVKDGKADAFASAGNSGAVVVGATTIVKRIKGIKRVTFAPIMPKDKGFFILADSGANTECRPEMLEQFAIMANVYIKKVMNIPSPRVGLLNVGTESHKGTAMHQEAYKLLNNNKSLNFIGNVEAREMPKDGADVLVADGFSGNIAVKAYEGVASMLMGKIKGIFTKNLITKIAAAIVLKEVNKLKKDMDYNEYGGAPIIGASKPVFKIHGSAKAKTVKNALKLTKAYVESGVIEEITKAVTNDETDRHITT